MVANSNLEGHDRTHLTALSSASSTSSSSSSSSSASIPLSWEDLQPPLPPPSPLPDPIQRTVPCVYLTHFPLFACKMDCDIITDTATKLERCGFYWGPIGVQEAHAMLKNSPLGSFLIRDSRQKDIFFTLSYHAKSGPVSVRLEYKKQRFSLAGNERTFPSLFALLEHYTSSPKKCLSVPYRKFAPTLQEICRKRVVELCGHVCRISDLPITAVAKDFLQEFPYNL